MIGSPDQVKLKGHSRFDWPRPERPDFSATRSRCCNGPRNGNERRHAREGGRSLDGFDPMKSRLARRASILSVLMQHQCADLAADIALEVELGIDHGVEEMILRLRIHGKRSLAGQLRV